MNFLLYCGAATQIIFVIVAFGGGSIAGLCLVRWLVPLDRLQKNHEVAGVTFGVLGAFYGLVLAFVIVAAWERFNDANAYALTEASALREPLQTRCGVLRTDALAARFRRPRILAPRGRKGMAADG